MSCFLTYKEAKKNLENDILKSGFVHPKLSNKSNITEYRRHNASIQEEFKKIKKVADGWKKNFEKLNTTFTPLEVKIRNFDGDRDSPVGFSRKVIDVDINDEAMNYLDDLRKSEGIYDSKLSLATHIENKRNNEITSINNTEVVKEGVEELFEENNNFDDSMINVGCIL